MNTPQLADELELSAGVNDVDCGLKKQAAARLRELDNRITELEEIISGQQERRDYKDLPF